MTETTQATGLPPRGGGVSFNLAPEAFGETPVEVDPDLVLPYMQVADDYFQFMDIRVLDGRPFAPDDRGVGVVIVNEAMAKHYWGTKSPVGRRFRLDPDDPWSTVVGVVADVKQMGQADPFGAMEIYYPLLRDGRSSARRRIAVRVEDDDPLRLAEPVRGLVAGLDEQLPVNDMVTLEALVGETVARPRFFLMLITGFAGVGLLLAVIGLYGVISYSVAQRTREIGIRMALGAKSSTVLRMVVRGGVVLVGIGLASGLVAGVFVTRFLTSMLFEVERTDPVTYALVAMLLAVVAVAAAYIPARRASAVDPVIAIRTE